MKVDDVVNLSNIVGKTVKEIWVGSDDNNNGFDLVFDDGTILKICDDRCTEEKISDLH